MIDVRIGGVTLQVEIEAPALEASVAELAALVAEVEYLRQLVEVLVTDDEPAVITFQIGPVSDQEEDGTV